MRDLRSGVAMALVNDTWLEKAGVPGATAEDRRIEFASISRGLEASTTKILSDAQLEQFVQYLSSDCGWDQLSRDGAVPANGGLYTSTIEVRIDGVAEHAGFVASMPEANFPVFSYPGSPDPAALGSTAWTRTGVIAFVDGP